MEHIEPRAESSPAVESTLDESTLDEKIRPDTRPGAAVWFRLAVAVVLFALPLLLFVTLARDVAGGGILPFDEPVMMWLHGLAAPWLTGVTEVVTETGGLIAVPIVAAVVAGFLWWRGHRWGAAFLAASVIGSTLLNTALKAVFRRSRPDFWEHLVVETSFSFPSGHAMASMSMGAALIVLVWRARTAVWWRAAAVAGVILYVLIVGVSRLYLGVHYPSDVLAGWCVAVLWVAVVAGLVRRQVRDAPRTNTEYEQH